MRIVKSIVISAMALFFAGTAAFGETVKLTFDVDTTVFNACTGEDVYITGRGMTLLTSVVNNNAVHTMQKSFQHYQGVGLSSGDEYVGHDKSSLVDIAGIAPKDVFMITVDANLVSMGGGPNLIFRQQVHITTNANGDVTADILSQYTICQ